MSIIKAVDVAYVRFRAPDLGRMGSFLEDFGMKAVFRSDRHLFMRGHGTDPFVHATELGQPGFSALGIEAADIESLRLLAQRDGVEVLPSDAPGGGSIVRLTDPDGFLVEVVAGRAKADPLPHPDPAMRNEGGRTIRRSPHRTGRGPSHVMRLGHVVLGVSDFRTSEAWYKERFGLLTSDEIQPAPDVGVGAFMRCDRGDQPSDHHTIFIFQKPGGPGFMHAAFEVVDFDDLMAGHEHLVKRTHQHHWGIGRHILGSQIFDYWRDPWGHEVEHWTDGDRLTAETPPGVGSMDQLMNVQWGMEIPPIR